MKIGLVGCVKSKQSGDAPARELYVSALFRGRRSYVERTCDRWFVLSAKHGLVEPEQVLAPYDEALARAPVAQRRRWSEEVLAALRERLGDLGQHDFDIHAGAAYRDHGLEDGLRRAGARVDVPARGLRQGPQLRFYNQATSTIRRD